MPRNIFLLLLFLHFTCTQSEVENKSVASTTQESTAAAQVTVLANLPDSLQPEIILLEHLPAPKTVPVPDKQISIAINQKSGQYIMNLHPPKKIKASFSSVLQNYTTEQGLAQDVTSCVYADKKGNLWIGTHVGGVSKYDGHTFTNYTTAHGLVDNRIKNITEDNVGNIWFATMGGVSKFDGTSFSAFGKFKVVASIFEDSSGNLWFATGKNGLYKYAGDSITRYSQLDGLAVNAVKEDKKGIIWIGTDNGLYSYDGEKFKNIALSNFEVWTITIDKIGNIWAGNQTGYRKYDGANVKSYPSAYDGAYNSSAYKGSLERISSLLYNPNGTYNSAVGLVDGLTVVGLAEGITKDKSGNTWVGSSAHGIFKYSGQAFQKLTSSSVRSIFEDEAGNIWFSGTINSIIRFDGEYFTTFELTDDNYWSLFQDKTDNIWIGSDRVGLIKFGKNSYTFYTDLNGLADNAIRSIMQDSKGDLWIGTEKGLSKFDGRSFTNFTKKQGLAGDYVACILEDKPGELLIGTDGGLSIFDGNSFANYSLSQIPQGNDTRSIIKDKFGNLWLGTYGGGLARYDGKSFSTYTTAQGLPDNVVTQVASTKEGNIIVGTNNGIAILTGFKSLPDADANNLNNTSADKNVQAHNNLSNSELKNHTPVFEIYNPNTGYPVMDVNRGQHAIFEDSKGFLWIASGSEKSGLMRLDYSSLVKNNNPPELNILSIKVGNELVAWHNLLNPEKNIQKPISTFETITVPASVAEEVTTFGKPLSDVQREEMRRKYKGIEFDGVSKFYPVPQHLVLPNSHNNITIEFAAIDPDKPLLVQYQYMLEGYNKNWSTPANITSASFGNMYEGKYHFQVKACSPSGIWSEPITYSFIVLPPWWRTWWAYTTYALAFLFALRVFSKYRERNLRLKNEKLERTVALRTEELVHKNSIVEKQKLEVEKQKQRSDDLLLNILPAEVAEELKANGHSEARNFESITVMFTDFKNFTNISEKMSPEELVREIDVCFSAFDNIIHKYGIEKIKTIGDSYMCAGGLPVPNNSHAENVVNAAFEIRNFIANYNKEKIAKGKLPFEIRIGINTGPVVAGIVGVKKFAYDIWGDTVNIASRLENNSEAGKINISESTYELVKDKFTCTHRGKIQAKNKGEIDMYFVEIAS